MKRNLLLVCLTVLFILTLISGTSIFGASSATVNWNTLKQPIDGFGISEAFHQANNINIFPEPQRTEILDLLFSTTKGAGFSILRNIVGDGGTWGNAIDGPNATIEPREGVWWDWSAKNDDQIWLMNECKNTYGVTRFMSTVWSPPAWMKTNNSVTGGGNVAANKYQQYAEYLAEYVNGYKTHYGIDIYAISMSNEPNLSTSYSSCQWNSSQITDFVGNYVKPVFQQKNVPAKFMVNEHMSFDESLVVDALNNTNAGSRIDIVGVHCYGSSPVSLPTTKSKGKRLWLTEVSNLNNNDPSITDGLSWARMVHDFMTVAEGNAFFYWWGACYKTYNGEALIRMDMNAKTYSADKRLFTIGNYSRFVRPGWVRIDATASPASNVYITAYKEAATGKFAIVAINSNGSAQNITFTLSGFAPSSVTPYRTSATENLAELSAIAVSGGTFTATLAANSVTSFVGTATGGPVITPTPPVVTPTPTPTTTTQSAFSQIEAESFNAQSGIQTESCSEGGQNIGYIENGDYVVYNDIDFGSGATGFQARVASSTSGGNIEIRLDSVSGTLIGTCPVAGTGGWQTWTTSTCSVSGVSGIHNLYLRFTGGSGYLFNINWFKFTSGIVTPTATPTPVRTPTPTRTATPVVTPTPSSTATPLPTPGTPGAVKVQFFNQSKTDPTNQLYMNFQLVNTGSSAVILSNVKMRYWYTEDGTQTQNFYCDYSPVGSSNVTGTFVKMGAAKTGADTYLEIGFSSGAGNLAAGASIQVQCRCAKSDWSNYTQSNDYSFNSSASGYVDWTKVTGYVSGALQWGTEP